jgi:hypothetical protein
MAFKAKGMHGEEGFRGIRLSRIEEQRLYVQECKIGYMIS